MRLRAVLALAGLLAVGGCVGPVAKTQGTCVAENASYLATWDCIRTRLTATEGSRMSSSDLGIHYLAVGDALAERVRARQITDADAKLALANELRSATSESRAREAASAASSDALLAAGAALLTSPPIAAPAPTFNQPITCTSRRVGYTVQTTC